MRRVLALLLCVCVPALTHALPNELIHEGLVQDERGVPLGGEHTIRVRIYPLAEGGAPLFDETHPDVPFFDGYFFVAVGSRAELDPTLFAREALFMGITLDDDEEQRPRIPLRKVPAAMMADVAQNAVGDITPRSVAIDGVGPIIDARGRWVGDPSGLRGPPGPEGPQGPAGEVGGDGSPDTPEQVRAKLREVDGAGSGVDADLLDGRQATDFLRADVDTRARGDVRVDGNLSTGGVAVVGDRIRLNDGGADTYATLLRPNTAAEAGIRWVTGAVTDWRQFLDNDANDRDLRWRSDQAAGFSDRAPQMRLSEAGDLRVGRDVAAARDLAVGRSAQVGHLRVQGLDNATITLLRQNANQKAGLTLQTGAAVDWRLFADSDGSDDLRILAPGAAGFGDANPQLRLTPAGDLAVGRGLTAATVATTGVAVRGDARAGALLTMRSTVDPPAGAPLMSIDSAAGQPLLRVEGDAGARMPGIAGSGTGLHVLGATDDAGELRLQASRNANASRIELRNNRIELMSLSGGGEATSSVSVLGPTGHVGVGTTDPEARLHTEAQRDEVLNRQSRRGQDVSFDVDVDDGDWTLTMSGAESALITAEGPADRVHIPNLVISASATAPEEPTVGQIYFDRDEAGLFVWTGEAWEPLIGGEGGGNGGGQDGGGDVPPVIPGFEGVRGPDLSDEGYSQCYGWRNDGRTSAPALGVLSQTCGTGTDVVFAGHRCNNQFVRHDAALREPLRNYLIGERRFWRDFDIENRFSWHMSADWALLVRFNNAWRDPGRLWEPYIGNNAGNVGAQYGHVLSQSGNDAHDQHRCVGDAYYVYMRPPENQPQAPVRNGLVGYWPLDGNGRDVSGNNLHGRSENGVRYVEGRVGQAARIDANDDAIRVVDANRNPLDARMVTMAAWVNPVSCRVPADRGIIMNKESVYEFGLRDGTCELQAAFSPCWRWWGSARVPTNTWTHVAIVLDGNQQIHYVNGERREATACRGFIAENNADFKIGSRGGDAGNSSDFNGMIDEALLYDRPLRADEVRALYLAGVGPLGEEENPARSCKAIIDADDGADSGVYWLDPDGAGGDGAFQAYCDMETDGGGWTMCYSTERHAHVDNRGFAGTFGQNGYRTNCRKVRFDEVIYRNHANDQVAMFRRDAGGETTIEALGFNVRGNVLGTWTGRGVADARWRYQLNICDRTWMQVGLMMTGFTNCWKACNSWCGDRTTHYYRVNGEGDGVRDNRSYNGVAFRENGHRNVDHKLMSVGIR